MSSSITVLMTINKSIQSEELARKWLDVSADGIGQLNPKRVLVDTIESAEGYNDFCVNRMDRFFDTDYVLVVQLDGFVARPDAWSDDFFGYDYIGAPWQEPLNPSHPIEYRTPYTKNRLVGNGGFSLRSRRLYEKIHALGKKLPPKEGEDVFICLNARNELESMGVKFATYEVAKKFSVERDAYEGQFGVHDWVRYKGNTFHFKEVGDFNKYVFLDNINKDFAIDKTAR